MILIKIRQGHLIVPVIFFLFSQAFCEHPDSTLQKIELRKNYFNPASEKFDIDFKLLISIVFTERTQNVDWKDKALDVPMAMAGYNSSVGFCQVKIKTAYWIETQLNDSSSIFYPGEKYVGLLKLSTSTKELLTKLEADSLNILYAAAYLRIIQNYWDKQGFNIDNQPDILGTLYSIGMFGDDGKARKPHAKPKANWFGEKVKSSFGIFNPLFKNTKL